MLGIPLNNGDICGIHFAHQLALITVVAVQTYNLSSKLPAQAHQLHCPASRSHFPTPLRHAEKSSCIETEQRYLCRIRHFKRQNIMFISPPKD